MNLLLTVASLIVLLCFAISRLIEYKRFKYNYKLKNVYDRMELYFLSHKIPMKKDFVELLKIHKNLSVNVDYLDIQILILSKIAATTSGKMSEMNKWYADTVEKLPPDFLHLLREFDDCSNKLISLSLFKPDFILFVLRIIFPYIPKLFKKGLFNAFNRVRREAKAIYDNEIQLSRYGMMNQSQLMN